MSKEMIIEWGIGLVILGIILFGVYMCSGKTKGYQNNSEDANTFARVWIREKLKVEGYKVGMVDTYITSKRENDWFISGWADINGNFGIKLKVNWVATVLYAPGGKSGFVMEGAELTEPF